MSDDLDRLSRLLDDLAAERDPHERAELSPDEADLARTAALLKAASPAHALPDDGFVEQLGARLSAEGRALEAPDARSDITPTVPTVPAVPTVPPTTPAAPAVPLAPTPEGDGLSRRGLLGRAASAAAGLVLGTGAGAAAAYDKGTGDGYHDGVSETFTTPMVPGDRGEWLDTGHTLAGVAAGGAVRFRAGALEGFLVNPGGGKPLYALSAACTHMGCLISWLDGAGTFLCPCHGAQYNPDGTVLSGIARHPLPRLHVRIERDGGLYVWSVRAHPAITTLAPYAK